MHIKRMHEMQECLTEYAQNEFKKGIENVNTVEMAYAIDMIKDLAEAEYRATITKSMDEYKKEEEEYDKILLRELKEEFGDEAGKRFYDHYRYADGRFAPKGHGTYQRGYSEPYYHMTPEMYRDMDKYTRERMYFTETGIDGRGTGMHDVKMSESNYDRAKRNYTETKEMHRANTPQDKEAKMRELEKYMKELSADITDLMSGMSQEEMNMAKSKLTTLVSKM